VVGFFEHQKANAQAADSGLSSTIACIGIDSLTYWQLQQTLNLSAKFRNCQRGGFTRHKLPGVFGTDETHRAILSLVGAECANVCWFNLVKIPHDHEVDIPTGP